MGQTPYMEDGVKVKAWGEIRIQSHESDLGLGWFVHPKDYLSTRFLFTSITRTLGIVERKEHPMNVIALTIIFIVRVLVPLTILLTLGEWVQHREKNYWLRM